MMNRLKEPYTLATLEEFAKGIMGNGETTALFEQEVKAFTAEDALTQLRAAEGGSLGQPPFVFAITPLPDEISPRAFSQWSDKDINIELDEAKCACGAVAVQWRKDTPICAKPECLTPRQPPEENEQAISFSLSNQHDDKEL
jgi:hypothetical protein